MSLRTPITLVVLLALVAAGGWYGWTKLQEPFDNPFADRSDDCVNRTIKAGSTLGRDQVVVDVYNAGSRPDLASSTMDKLTNRGFRRGTATNAPRRVKVGRITILDKDRSSADVRLVRAQFQGKVPVQRRPNLGDDPIDGIDVVVGNGYRGLARPTPRTVRVRENLRVCLPRAPRKKGRD
ncbi:MAG TPA: LytR C-terminal domain-containing protein [Nocardioidaceae bacterium]|nr:LytR C-terminal domain-containing protein [Nocardioidaceae bacterium]